MLQNMKRFFEKSTREENDSANKSREEILSEILTMTFSDTEVREQFLQDELRRSLALVYSGTYSTVELIRKGGRGYNYDFDAVYTGEETVHKKIEFKYGCSSIDKLPQFLSLSVKQFLPDFIPFWWSRLDAYLACDEGITHTKPPLDEYTRWVSGMDYSVLPFFQQLKEREHISKTEKNKVVNDCIQDFLQASTVSIDYLQQRFAEQQDKYFFFWNKKMTVDRFTEREVANVQFHSVTKNSILLTSDGARFKLLLRWRNRKGILNPAWQISMKRK
jgi:hypothetical protein